jgi:nicotinate-nucleotide adenylyltransferase
MRPRVGLFGGTFDPPHLGHTVLAAEALEQLHLSRLLWVLTPDPPHKPDRPITPVAHRLEMVLRALEPYPEFELSRLELDRPPPHYAVDTVLDATDLHPGSDLVYLIGGDSLRDLPTWHDPTGFVAACTQIGVMRRPGETADLAALEAALPGLTRKLAFVDAPLIEISSTEIRGRAAAGRPFRQYLLPSVYEYVVAHKLYGTAAPAAVLGG